MLPTQRIADAGAAVATAGAAGMRRTHLDVAESSGLLYLH